MTYAENTSEKHKRNKSFEFVVFLEQKSAKNVFLQDQRTETDYGTLLALPVAILHVAIIRA